MIAMERSVRWVADLIHPRGYREGLTIVLSAYVDASDENPGIPVAAVAGFVARTNEWEKFENLWKPFLQEFGLEKRFHASNFWAREGEFKRWPDAKFLLARGHVCSIINKCHLLGVGSAIDTRVFDEWLLDQDRWWHSDPHYFCLERILYQLIFSVSEYPYDEGIAIYIDQDKKHEKIGCELAEWHERRLRRLPEITWSWSASPQRAVSTHYVSSIDHVPVQAADVLVNSMHRNMHNLVRANSGEQFEAKQHFLDGFNERLIAKYWFCDRESIEADFEARVIADAADRER